MNYSIKYNKKFDGSFVYYIIERRTQAIVYIGETSNIVTRYSNHMSEGDRVSTSAFHNWCRENNRDKSDFEMVVLDLSEYDTLDYDDRRIMEKSLQLVHRETLIAGKNRTQLNVYEAERFEYMSGVVDFDFKSYTQIKVERHKKQNSPTVGKPQDYEN